MGLRVRRDAIGAHVDRLSLYWLPHRQAFRFVTVVHVGRSASRHSGRALWVLEAVYQMKPKKQWGLIAPFIISFLVIAITALLKPAPPVKNGVMWGIGLALAQSYLSTAVMYGAWKTNFFYWAWGGGIFFRMLVFAATAYVFYQYAQPSFVAAMLTMVTATTLFLVLESTTFFSKPL